MLNNKVWNKVAPSWPLQNIVACNPLLGYIDQKFDDVLTKDINLFQIKNLPKNLEELNMHNIKYLQAFFDDSQAIISMPNKHKGLLESSRDLLLFDTKIVCKNKKQKLKSIPTDLGQIIEYCLNLIQIPNDKKEIFLHILITTLYGWSSFIKYKSEWESSNLILQDEFLALRVILFTLISDDWESVTNLDKNVYNNFSNNLKLIKSFEQKYQNHLFNQLSFDKKESTSVADAQFIFCIDVRSEPIRRHIEASGNYETFGFAGFFGLPIRIKNKTLEQSYSSCPVLIKPSYDVEISTNDQKYLRKNKLKKYIKQLYSNFKYNFSTPFLLVDICGLASAYKMIKKMLKIKESKKPIFNTDISNIPFEDKVNYAKNFLTSIGLTRKFAKNVVICGHKSCTTNNAFASALECGACGGHQGKDNAEVMVKILNDKLIRSAVSEHNIIIPDDTIFIPALHNTTTNKITYYGQVSKTLNMITNETNVSKSLDWSETRPEWGLSRNASFIIGPREFTEKVNLDGRSFLHSYDYTLDKNGSIISTILNAPMVVGHWINSQYLFSTIDNKALGAGSKITHNISGKSFIMQGNASDIMHGLPLQSLYQSDKELYHEPARLTTIIYGEKDLILKAIKESDILNKLFSNEWVFLYCFDIPTGQRYNLNVDLQWKINH